MKSRLPGLPRLPFAVLFSVLCCLVACGAAPARSETLDLGQELPADPSVEAGGHIAQPGEKVVYDHPPKRAKPKARDFSGRNRRGRRNEEPEAEKAQETPQRPEPEPEAESAAAAESTAAATADTTAPEHVETPADVAAPPADAVRTMSGLASKVLRPGTGTTHPGPTTKVRVHYSGWTTDGKLFDSSVVRGEPITFPLDRVIPGWSEGVQLMVVGEKRRLWIPQSLAYKGRDGAPKGMLVFDIELLGLP